MIGLIGGKEVGKSALVNALAGREITASSSHGAGTDHVIAYCHQSRADRLRELLEREVNDKYRIIAHSIDRLSRQVLLDLPDIDSHYAEHMEITRRMLRHILFPIWMQSIEKYADQRPRELLAKVAAGNDPGNFIFCLNKADQVEGAGDRGLGVGNAGIGKIPLSDPRSPIPDPLVYNLRSPAMLELRDDYAIRIARTLGLELPLRQWMRTARTARWSNLAEVRRDFPHADPARVASGGIATIFNIAGNRYRLITAIHYNTAKVFILCFLTHAEYDKDAWKETL